MAETKVSVDKVRSLDAILKNEELTLKDKLADVIVWGRDNGLIDIESKIEKAINDNRLWYVTKNKVRYIDKQGVEKEYSLKKMVKVAIKVGDWQGQMNLLGISGEDIYDIFCKMHSKYYMKKTITCKQGW